MKRKKALAVLLTLGMALGMLSGCGSEPSADKAGQPADAAAEKDTTGETQESRRMSASLFQAAKAAGRAPRQGM